LATVALINGVETVTYNGTWQQ